jgi:hypothetical protein
VVAQLAPRHRLRAQAPVPGSTHINRETFYKLIWIAKMLGINYESSDEEDTIPATKADVSHENVCEGP